eukprot:TRINITY_DN77234_c0_g1_i1.p1 TRINITY_DN77234_c0_g1~~TRINITY_DN77234_c0_g1_i1.p1  ORF type:complete len:443 (-),score=51.86 TRINITY_DN77234_c0_g1_i1:417-1745(-)
MYGCKKICFFCSLTALAVLACLPLIWTSQQNALDSARQSAITKARTSTTTPTTEALPIVVDADLLPFALNGSESLSPEASEDAWNFMLRKHHHVALRIVIRHGMMYLESPKVHHDHALVLVLLKIHCYLGGLPDVELIINTDDWGVVEKPRVLPIWSWTKDPDRHNDLLMPYWSAAWLEHTAVARERMAESATWGQRASKLIWRGSQTGYAYPKVARWWETWTSSNWRQAPRARLALACRNLSYICDAGFHRIMEGVSADVEKEIRKEGLVKAPVDATQVYPRPKYSLLIDGNGAPSSRSISEFGDGRATFWVESPDVEIWYSGLKPYIHFIPVKRDLSDLTKQLRWAMSHDSEVQAIAKRAREFAQQTLRDYSLSIAWRSKVYEFAKLQAEPPAVAGASTVKLQYQTASFVQYYVKENARSLHLGPAAISWGDACLEEHTR